MEANFPDFLHKPGEPRTHCSHTADTFPQSHDSGHFQITVMITAAAQSWSCDMLCSLTALRTAPICTGGNCSLGHRDGTSLRHMAVGWYGAHSPGSPIQSKWPVNRSWQKSIETNLIARHREQLNGQGQAFIRWYEAEPLSSIQ